MSTANGLMAAGWIILAVWCFRDWASEDAVRDTDSILLVAEALLGQVIIIYGTDNMRKILLLRGKGITTHFVKYYLFDGTGRNSVYYCSTYARRDPTNMYRTGKVARERWAARLYPSAFRSPFLTNDMVIGVLCHTMIILRLLT
jgi:hypothetical protein